MRWASYTVVEDATGGWFGVGYGNHPTSQTTGADGVIFRFNAAGIHDQTFGTHSGGVSVYRYAEVAASDQFRNLIALPDGRFAAVGRVGITGGATPATDAAVVIFKPDGSIDTTVGTNGAFTANLGDTGDEYYGVALSADRSKLLLAGFRTGTQDDGAVTRLILAGAGSQGPAGPSGPAGAGGKDGSTPLASPGTPGPAGPAGPTGPEGADGKSLTASNVSVTCKLTGRNKISCSVKHRATKSAKASVRLRLAKGGKVVASGKATAKNGAATVSLKGRAKAGTYTLIATVPTASGKYRKITQTLVLR